MDMLPGHVHNVDMFTGQGKRRMNCEKGWVTGLGEGFSEQVYRICACSFLPARNGFLKNARWHLAFFLTPIK
jgi:hypothetical protein